ncbi:uncharacterized protein LOC144113634 [Amblyomma americanum]
MAAIGGAVEEPLTTAKRASLNLIHGREAVTKKRGTAAWCSTPSQKWPRRKARLKILRCPSARSTDGSKIAFATGPAARSSCVPLVPSCLSSVSYGSYKPTSKRAMNFLRGAAASCEQLIRKLVPRPLNVLGIQGGDYARDDLHRLESNSRTAKVRKKQAPTSLSSVAPCSHVQLPDVHARLFPCSLHSTDDVTPQPDQAAAVVQPDCLLGSGTFPPKWLQEINDQGQHSIRFTQPAACAASAASTNSRKDPMDPSGCEDSGQHRGMDTYS